jgi:hypothetical protein
MASSQLFNMPISLGYPLEDVEHALTSDLGEQRFFQRVSDYAKGKKNDI